MNEEDLCEECGAEVYNDCDRLCPACKMFEEDDEYLEDE